MTENIATFSFPNDGRHTVVIDEIQGDCIFDPERRVEVDGVYVSHINQFEVGARYTKYATKICLEQSIAFEIANKAQEVQHAS